MYHEQKSHLKKWSVPDRFEKRLFNGMGNFKPAIIIVNPSWADSRLRLSVSSFPLLMWPGHVAPVKGTVDHLFVE